MRFIVQIITLFTILILKSCINKENIDPPGGQNNQPISYRFENPINIKISHVGTRTSIPQEIVTSNYIFSELGNVGTGIPPLAFRINRIPIGNTNGTQGLTSVSQTHELQCLTGFRIGIGSNSGNSTSCIYTIDRSERFVYMLSSGQPGFIGGGCCGSSVGYQLFQWDLQTGVFSRITPGSQLNSIAGSNLRCLKMFNDTIFYLSSTYANGSIIKITRSGALTVIASQLINPGYFEIKGNNLFVPINTSTGKIVKIELNNNNRITDIVTNITGPTNVAIDNYGSLVIRSRTTINGGNYHRYDIYKEDGTFVANIRDANNTSILSDIYENTPMLFDSYNNLYFYHADGVASGGVTYNNPVGQKGLFKIPILKN